MLKAHHITKTYNAQQKVALQDFNIEVPPASIYGLLGPNGAGKTSFIRIINQIIKPDAGEVYIDNELLSLKHIQQIGYMPEERGLYKNMSVKDQILYFGELKGMSKNKVLEQAKKWFDILGIDQWWDKKISELSKGMAQKIQFVVTVLHRPKLLILDEPFSGFDPVNANLIKDQIIRLKNEGTTIILSTHRMESVEEMCDSVALIHRSRKVLDGTVYQVREQFKKNIFRTVLSDMHPESFQLFQSQFQIENFTTEHNTVSFEISGKYPQAELLSQLMKIGNIRVFEEKIPSMNEVFISATQGH